MEILNEYLLFLWQQFQYDWSIFTNGWVLYTVLPAVFYFIFFCIKWWILLVPLTLPLSIISGNIAHARASNTKANIKKELNTFFGKG